MIRLLTATLFALSSLTYAASEQTTFYNVRPATNEDLEMALPMIQEAQTLQGAERANKLKKASLLINPSIKGKTYNAAFYVTHGARSPEQQFIKLHDESHFSYAKIACYLGDQSEAIQLLNEAVIETALFWGTPRRINSSESESAAFKKFIALNAHDIEASFMMLDTYGHEMGLQSAIISKCNF
jgi:hypothetical protein